MVINCADNPSESYFAVPVFIMVATTVLTFFAFLLGKKPLQTLILEYIKRLKFFHSGGTNWLLNVSDLCLSMVYVVVFV